MGGKIKKINPTSLKKEDEVVIIDFLNQQSKAGISFWKPGTIYTLNDGTQFMLTRNIVARERASNATELRYEVISNTLLGQGTFGAVYEIAGTLSIKPGNKKNKNSFIINQQEPTINLA